MWDLKGKHLDVPVYELLGGKAHERVRTYTWIGGDLPSDVAVEAQERLGAGFTAVKMNATEEVRSVDSPDVVAAAADRIRTVREAVGDELDVALDFHGRVSKPLAGRLAEAVEPHTPFFIGEPVLAEHNEALPAVAAHTSAPVATGECMYTRAAFKQVLEQGAVDVVQPDLSHAGVVTDDVVVAGTSEAAGRREDRRTRVDGDLARTGRFRSVCRSGERALAEFHRNVDSPQSDRPR